MQSSKVSFTIILLFEVLVSDAAKEHTELNDIKALKIIETIRLYKSRHLLFFYVDIYSAYTVVTCFANNS